MSAMSSDARDGLIHVARVIVHFWPTVLARSPSLMSLLSRCALDLAFTWIFLYFSLRRAAAFTRFPT